MKKNMKNIGDILYYTLIGMTTILIFVVVYFIFNFEFFWSLVISLGTGAFFIYKQSLNEDSDSSKKLNRLSAEKEAFYKSKGMTKEEIQFFRETMHTAKLKLLRLEKNLNSISKLEAIEKRNNTIQLSKSLFKGITEEPNRLHEVNKFLYVHLPSLTDLTEKYLEISRHEVKNKSTFDILDESASTIDEMCQLIVEDYVLFKSDDFEDMAIEVELAKKAIERDNGNTQSIESEEL
ncbi:5-bromo-4-chloroindolyl phosphate hydrolysis family protein [Carnobacterium alterfunditum]|uniref:5-bromo-4-chloroindolyl phosphate hydrolysis family protein n=1 Tax=Carnobacterium alterfunditum TaxID=28230 RepID=UPI0035942780